MGSRISVTLDLQDLEVSQTSENDPDVSDHDEVSSQRLHCWACIRIFEGPSATSDFARHLGEDSHVCIETGCGHASKDMDDWLEHRRVLHPEQHEAYERSLQPRERS